jgi:hypothetical protein
MTTTICSDWLPNCGDASSFARDACPRLSDHAKRAYNSYLKLIEDEFDDLPIGALEDKPLRGGFLEFRAEFADRPQTGLLPSSLSPRLLVSVSPQS